MELFNTIIENNNLKLELFLRSLFSSPVWCVHGPVMLAQADTLLEKEQFCPQYLPISTPLVPSLTSGEVFMRRREEGAASLLITCLQPVTF